jgi:hypothetical protein
MNSAPTMNPLLVLLCGWQWATRQISGLALCPSFVGRQIKNELP